MAKFEFHEYALARPTKQIRLCWCFEGRNDHQHEPVHSAAWSVDTPEKRRDYETLVKAGNATYGTDSHWIKERII